MKKVGKQVLFLAANKQYPRMGEGSFVRLRSGSIMFAFTQYYGVDWDDHSIARIAACFSDDDGESFGDPISIIEKDEKSLNIMSVSLLRLQNGDIALSYLRKDMYNGEVICLPWFCRSTDEGKTWSEPICCSEEKGYFVVNNDRMIQLKNGRIILPLADHGLTFTPGKIRFVYSDDNGVSWQISDVKTESQFSDGVGFQEPGIFELPDGRLWIYTRTAYGHQYQSFSSDNGESWTAPTPNLYFTSPDSPMLVKKLGERAVAIFNPIPYSCVNENTEVWKSPKRTPYVCAISNDGGLSFDSTGKAASNGGLASLQENSVLLEDDLSNSYCYPAVIETNDGFLVAYYHSNGTKVCLNSTKITKVTFGEIDEALLSK